MYKMCHVCDKELTDSDNGEGSKKKLNSFKLDGRDNQQSCKSKKNEQDSSVHGDLSSYATPLISPTISLTSTDSLASSCSEFSIETNVNGREEGDEISLRNCQDYLSFRINGQVDNLSLSIPAKGIGASFPENGKDPIKVVGVDEGAKDGSGSTDQSKERSQLFLSLDFETNIDLWVPPEPQDLEDDVEGSVVDNGDGDDDECGDGTKWGKPSSLSSFDEEGSGSYRLEEERKKAMLEVMNGKFRALVSQLLRLEGISISGEAGENWVDIVTSLSWSAALLVKPDAFEGKAMDPGGYVKVKCIATGSCSQSEVIKGLVFKKNAAHKHMPTKHRNPRLLLLQGTLGQCSSGLSSFDSMDQEKDNLKTIIEMIEMCHPNVVFVEKTVSRDVQESLLAKGITLVFDMKLHRLERIARCAGSQIMSCVDNFMNQEMKQCDSFHFERFVEEHGSFGEGGKRPSKTLMFLEGCPRPLGCTILLKGAHSDELKKIKSVVQCAVLVAYHSILETSFLVDRRAMFSAIHSSRVTNGFLTDQQLPLDGSSGAFLNSNDSFVGSATLSCTTDIPISDEFQEQSVGDRMCPISDVDHTSSGTDPNVHYFENGIAESSLNTHNMPESMNECLSESPYEPFAPRILSGQLLSSWSASFKKVLSESIPIVSSTSYNSLSTYFGFKEKELDGKNAGVFPVTTCPESLDLSEMEIKGSPEEVKSLHDEQDESFPACSDVSLNPVKANINNEDKMQHNDGISSFLDAQSIVFLMCSQNVLRGTICEQNHLSRINYYRNSDISLGRFLHDNLLNQRNQCSKCEQPPEAHVYYYAHHNGRLTVRVRQLPMKLQLPGEAEGKLWMWTRCLKCKPENGILKSTRRVVLSTVSRGLSFGKFLELGFSDRSNSCYTHSLYRDNLFFYGLGPTVAMFRYSPLDIYAASMPPQVLEFNNPVGEEWLEREAKDVLMKGLSLFMEVRDSLSKFGQGFSSSLSNASVGSRGLVKKLSEVKGMLNQEKSDFEAFIQKVVSKNGNLGQGQSVHKLLSLNSLYWELLLQLYVWDRRLHELMLYDSRIVSNAQGDEIVHDEQLLLQKEDTSGGRIKGKTNILSSCEEICDDSAIAHIALVNNEVTLSSTANCDSGNSGINLENGLEVKLEETSTADEIAVTKVKDSEPLHENAFLESGEPTNLVNSFFNAEADSGPTVRAVNPDWSSSAECTSTKGIMLHNSVVGKGSSDESSYSSVPLLLGGDDFQGKCSSISEHLQVDVTNPITTDLLRHSDSNTDINICGSPSEIYLDSATFTNSLSCNSFDSKDWVWRPFSEIHKAYMKEIQRGNSKKFEFINNYTPECLTSVSQLIMHEGPRLHVPIGPDDKVVSIYKGELSSIIACALALLHDQHGSNKELVEDGKRERGGTGKTSESLNGLFSYNYFSSPFFSSTGSLDLDGMHSAQSVSSEDFHALSSDVLNLMDPLLSSEVLHPEISLGLGKLAGKGKYSVVCLYAKEFHALRRRCCQSELDYIASLSRCQNWDAKGGKSKSLFAKTLDDRFIIKEIKKTEFDSFLQFAPDYFKHINESFSSGSQTCLAKILGIYQVIIRQSKSGREMKHDLMVMENLTFGRNITRLYDLKGAMHSRYTSAADASKKVLLDQNFVEDMHVSPLFVSSKTKHLLQRAVWNDTSFLTSINVMDYSLLVGVDTQRHELVCGIIDYLRQYTWDKQLETWVKSSLVVPKNVSPTVISPKEYKKRFRKFMSMHFLSTPVCCNPKKALSNCKFCCRSDDSPELKSTAQNENNNSHP
ncbi:PREDICTED: putative 1-phosphatidylinositol-3-phosphate 5-kinase FAB1D [Nelumbo nucifera]|uniref:1-phosphatidylinositol-3-phosphate 5-kinase n=2 Tax=Nelumbo nucifera TaxID=4432 RepID=A0A822Z8H2_NELNU|nr:PREDICTED: putative 1-phosphatidylinositol-3-phosphate 5-kinase FAB1D [Nelumbo nucifera]DAD39356.1 TPA_asm: hypothetical protein HUJ06_013679 [Nelumbo nucifera]